MEGSIILVKHAMPELDPNLPPSKWQLGEKGLKQAKRFAEFVRDNLDVDPVIFSSEEPKAKETAKVISEVLGLTLKTNPLLAEIDRPALPLVDEEEHEKMNEPIFKNPSEPILGNESAEAALSRFESALKEITKDELEDERIIVTHGTVMSLFLEKYNEDIDGFDIWKKLSCPSYAVVNLEDYSVLELNGRPLKS